MEGLMPLILQQSEKKFNVDDGGVFPQASKGANRRRLNETVLIFVKKELCIS
jgi:hypothetical protein